MLPTLAVLALQYPSPSDRAPETAIVTMLVTVAVLAVVFLVIRGIVLWYWKVDRIVATLDRIEGHLARMARQGVDASTADAEAQAFRRAAASLDDR